MKVLANAAETRNSLLHHHTDGQTIGLVPTMGALHDGHLSLVTASRRHNDITVASIFVNPIQFNKAEDLHNYPKSHKEDLEALEKLGVDYVFMPSQFEMYPKKPLVKLSFGHLEEVMEGQYRPGHFSGVAIIVAKLFNIIQPTRAYFGQKDLQQFKVIEQLVNDLSLNIELVMMPIIREKSGLAMSSRNQRLSAQGRITASKIYRVLSAAATSIRDGKDGSMVIHEARLELAKVPELKTEYLELAGSEDLRSTGTDTDINRLVLCFAGYLEEIRLIDNVFVIEEYLEK